MPTWTRLYFTLWGYKGATMNFSCPVTLNLKPVFIEMDSCLTHCQTTHVSNTHNYLIT
jgi:hypothetical protein